MKQRKKVALALLTVCMMLLCIIPCAADDAAAGFEEIVEISASGECGDSLTWTLYADGELVIEGEGDMWDWKWGTCPWYSYKESITKVTIGDGVTSIGNYSFYSCNNLENITLPDSITSIGTWAFYYCSALKSITFPDGLTIIGYSAFDYCSGLTTITIPDNVTFIGEKAFYSCSCLTSATVLSRNVVFEADVYSYVGSNFTLYGYAGSTTEGYATSCKHNFVALDTPAEQQIPEDAVYFNGSYYKLYTAPSGLGGLANGIAGGATAWAEVKAACESLGGHLAVISSEEENDFLFDYAAVNTSSGYDSTYFGYSDTETEGVWKWVTDEEVTYTNWSDGEPNNSNGNEDFACFWTNLPNGTWNDGHMIIGTFNYLCEWEVDAADAPETEAPELPDGIVNLVDYGTIITSSTHDVSAAFDGTVSTGAQMGGVTQNFWLGIELAEPTILSHVRLAPVDSDGDGLAERPYTIFKTVVDGSNDGKTWHEIMRFADNYSEYEDYAKVYESGENYWTEYAFDGETDFDDDAATPTAYKYYRVWNDDGYDNWGEIEFWGTFGEDLPETEAPETEAPEPEREITDSGECGDSLTWVLYADGELVINGEGDMWNWTSYGAPWYSLVKSITNVTISDSVTSIGNSAFYNCSGLTSVTIPDSVSSIGNSAFCYCSGLTSVTIPDSVISIGDYAFRYCSGLTTAPLGKNVTKIGSGVYTLCTGLTSVTIPDGVTSIGYYAFDGCSNLASVTIPDSVTYIGLEAFSECKSLTSITIPKNVTSILDMAFFNCTSLTSITVDPNNPGYSSDTTGVLFNKNKTQLIQYPSGGSAASYTIPDSVTSIAERAFTYSSGLTSVTIPESVTSIRSYAFVGCGSLTNATVFSRDANFGTNIFGSCSADFVLSGYAGSTAEAYASANGHTFSVIRTPDACGDTLTWSLSSDGVLTIDGEGAMWNYNASDDKAPWADQKEKITKVVIGSGVTSIGKYAFHECSALAAVEFEEGCSLTLIDEYAFNYASSLESITIPASVKKIWHYAFQYASNLKTVEFEVGSKFTHMGGYVFRYCTALETLELPATIIYIDEANILSKAMQATVIVTEDSYAHNYAVAKGYNIELLSKCGDNLTWVIKDGVLVINGTGSMNNYEASGTNAAPWASRRWEIEKVVIGKDVTTIGKYAFYACSNMTEVVFEAGSVLTTIDEAAFSHASSLESITIPATVTKIWHYAFQLATSLKTVEFDVASTLSQMGGFVFMDCTALETVELPESITYIDANILRNATQATVIVVEDSYAHTYAVSKGYNVQVIRKCGVDLIWTLKNGVLTISGTGKMYDYAADGENAAPWASRRGEITKIVIENEVTSIGKYAFYGCSNATAVEFEAGSTLTLIDEHAFDGASSLESITIPASVKKLWHYAFQYAASLKTAAFENGSVLGHLGGYVFRYCTALETVELPASIIYIDLNILSKAMQATVIVTEDSYAHNYALEQGYNIRFTGEHLHQYEVTVETEPTCTESGTKLYSCTSCEYSYTETIAPLGHSYTPEVTAPTCTEQGYTTYTCVRCESTTKGNLVSPLGHSFGDWQVETEPTCTEVGSGYRVCGTCGHTETEELPALGHSYSAIVTMPTCTEQGYTTYTCEHCGDFHMDDYVAELGHSCGDWVTDTEPTCTEPGSMSRVCGVCSEYTETAEIPALGHSFGEWQGETEPTCTASGSKYRVCGTCGQRETETLPVLPHNYASRVVAPTCAAEGYVLYTCSACGHSYMDSFVPALGHSFGGWTVELEPTVLADGYRYRVCTVCGHTEYQTIDRVEIDIDENSDYGLAVFTVVNAQTRNPIHGAQIFISTETDGENTFITDANGQVSIVLPIGKQTVSAYAKGCLTRNLTVNILPGVNEISQIGLSNLPTYEAEITSERMTIEEIEDAGIDTTAPGNQNVYKYELKLEFDPELDVSSIITYFNEEGTYLGGYSPNGSGGSGGTGGSGGSGGGTITPPTGGGIRIPVKNDVITVYPVSEYFYLIVRGEVTWLKEMFDVEMLIINNSNTDTLEDLTATLELPDGLSLATMVGEQQSLAQEIDHIAEGESKAVRWYIRGDKAGSYSLQARLEGMIMPFEEPIDDLFIGEDEIQVWAGDALHLHFEFPNAAYYGEDYPITITLTNVSDITLYNLHHMIQTEQGMIVYYSNGTSKETIDLSAWKGAGVREFHPGDSIIIETSVNIFFESRFIRNELEKLIGVVDGIELLIDACNVMEIVLNTTDTLVNGFALCLDALADFDFTAADGGLKTALFGKLYDEIAALADSYAAGSKTLDAAVGLANGGVINSLYAIAENPEEWLNNHSMDDIAALIDRVVALKNSIENDAASSDRFDIFDSIRTVISAIPVRFALKNVIMTEDENNTASIPWSFSVTDASEEYFGVSNVGKYLQALVNAALGEIYEEAMPWYLQLIPGLDDPFNQGTAIRYIKATENEIVQFKAKDAARTVTFKAWIETSEPDNFSLSCDNETAILEDGVLSFTGDGMISVIPHSKNGGTLYIEADGSVVYTYVIDVVEPHTCVTGKMQTVINPAANRDGFAIKCCAVCGEIMEIIPLYYEDCCEEHTFGEPVTLAEATCTTEGVQALTCEVCGAVEYLFTEKAEHSFDSYTAAVKATCIAGGNAEYHHCAVCDKNYDAEGVELETVNTPINPDNHTGGTEIRDAKEGIGSADGYTGDTYCLGCGEMLEKGEVIPGFLLGDLDRDGLVNIQDALLLFRHSMLPVTYPISYNGSIDFTKDGCIDIHDASRLFRYSLLPDLYPIG